MSAAIPHFVRLVERPGQPAHVYPCPSLRAALDFARWWFGSSFEGCSAAVYRGKPNDVIDRDPVQVWS